MNGVGDWPPALVAACAAVAVAVAGGVATVTDDWYRALRVPAWKPPDWAFGPIWSVIITLSAVAAVLAWTADPSAPARTALLVAYAANAGLNIAWSVIFFRLRRPDLAFVEVLLLWLSIAALVAVTGRAALAAGLLNLPYLAWVATAAVLNFRILRLNPQLREA